MERVDPRTGSALPPVELTTPGAVAAALASARAAQPPWSQLTAVERARRLSPARDRFLESAGDLVEAICEETGKPAAEAYTSEIVPNVSLFDYHLKESPALLTPKRVKLDRLQYPGKWGRLELLPRGTIGLITPWNYPVSIALRTLLPALVAGNAVLFKPSEYTLRCSAMVARLFDGLVPRGLLQLLPGAGDVGAALVEAGCDRIVFTGSAGTGRRIAEEAGRRLIPVSLELGGKDAAIVLADAAIERAAAGIVWGAFTNAGQNCASVERVYVLRDVADRFLEAVLAETRRLRLGPGREGEVDVGPLSNRRQLEIVEAHVADALRRGARAVAGGRATGRGFHFEPTVLTGVTPEMRVMREETFGPVLPIRVVESEDQAVAEANDSAFGLTASVWGLDLEHAETVARRLSAGTVTMNNHGFTAAIPHVPWSGVRESGWGVTNSPFGLHELVQPRFLLLDRSTARRELWWYPYNAELVTIAKNLIVLAGRGLLAKLGAIARLLRALPRRFST